MRRWKVAGINFDHFHMGDNLQMAWDHPQVDIVGICDERPDRLQSAKSMFQLSSEQVFTDYRQCIEQTQPDIVLLCPAAAEHGVWTQRVASHGVHIIIEKPLAASLLEADHVIQAMRGGGGKMVVNWPMTWYPTNQTAYRLIQEGRIGQVIEVHYYDGNRGPLWHVAGKEERTAAEVAKEKPGSWFYSQSHGGGSMLDYLGYGTTLATWFNGGQIPIEVMAMVDEPPGLEVDEHAIAVVRYAVGLSKFETRWGTFTDPWTHQPQPRCGFVVVGTEGTISSYDFQKVVQLQSHDHPDGLDIAADAIAARHRDPVQYLIHCLETEEPIQGPSSLKISRIGQQIVDAAVESARCKKAVAL